LYAAEIGVGYSNYATEQASKGNSVSKYSTDELQEIMNKHRAKQNEGKNKV